MNVLVAIYSRFASWNIPDTHVRRLRETFPQHEFRQAASEPEVRALIGDADAAFASELRSPHLAAARRLRWVHSPAAGVGGMLSPEMIASPIVMSNSRGLSADTIAEHVVLLALALFRKLPLALRRQAERTWAQDEALRPPPIRTIRGADVLVVGLGGIGAACASRFASLGGVVTGIRRRQGQPAPKGVTSIGAPFELRSRLAAADVVVLAAPQTADTRGLIGEAELAVMRPGAILINVSRGKLVDEAALARALAGGSIGGAGLDVFEQEPLSPESPLWTLPNVIITPHMAGFRDDHWDAVTALFAENLRRFERGEALLNVVDKHAGY